MNSEELEMSLRTEFESHLKNVLADMQQEFSQFQEKIEAELEKHRSQLDGLFLEFSNRIQTDKETDAGFKDSVVEHLRLARDEGAKITAEAFAKAEEMEKEMAAEKPASETPAPEEVGLSFLRNATSEISKQTSQATVLNSLVEHAARFAPRGAFFIVKNDHFVGWRVFGQEAKVDDEAVREVVVPSSSSTILSEAVRSLSAVESSFGTYEDDTKFLEPTESGAPLKMFAIPLIARGRGVAVLYADTATEDKNINIEALETLLCVAGLTVEVLASAPSAAQPAREATETSDYAPPEPEQVTTATSDVKDFENTDNYQKFEHTEDSEKVEEYQLSEEEMATVFVQPIEEDVPPSFEGDSFSAHPDSETKPAEQDFVSDDSSIREIDVEGFRPAEIEVEEFKPSEITHEEVESVLTKDETPETLDSFEPAFGTNDFPETVSEEYLFEKHQPPAVEETPAEELSKFDFSKDEAFEAPQFDVSSLKSTDDFDVSTLKPADDFVDVSTLKSSEDFSSVQDFSPVIEEEFEPVKSTKSKNKSAKSKNGKASKAERVVPAPVEVVSEPVVETVSPPVAETVSETAAAKPVRTRLSDRNVDLPIEVSEDERRLHNDARRFARLLVSEIKLYNEQKVREGREASDLYDRLREAIDRSREMYDKRVQPPVAAKFDYFHYELVSSLAEGEENKLGGGYPGAVV